MIVGVYWHFDFPDGLYEYDFFKYRKGLGGHADAPSELTTSIKSPNNENVITALKELVQEHPDALIFIYSKDSHLKIGTGGYRMFDFEFELAVRIEEILKENSAVLIEEANYKDAEFIRLEGDSWRNNTGSLKEYLQIVGSPLRKSNAETSSIRFDFNLKKVNKAGFLKDIENLTKRAHIDVVYYLEKDCGSKLNLIMFFTNGRLGQGLTSKQRVNIELFENELESLISNHGVETGFIEGWGNYPNGKPIILKAVDQEFIFE